MKKILLTFICCLTILLYIPFNTFANETQSPYLDGNKSQLSDKQLDFLNNNFDKFNGPNSIILFYPNSSSLHLCNNISIENTDNIVKVSGTFTAVGSDGQFYSSSDYFFLHTVYLYSYIVNSNIIKNICSDTDLNLSYCSIPLNVNISSNPSDGGSTSGSGSYHFGDNVNITATPNALYKFNSWSDGNIELSRNITILDDIDLVANFTSTVSDKSSIIYQTIYTSDYSDCYVSMISGNNKDYRTTLHYIKEERFIGNFDLYIKDGDSYKKLLNNSNHFSLKSNLYKNSSDFKNSCPAIPNLPSNSLNIYDLPLVYGNYLFVEHSSSNELIISAPDTDKLLSDGNSNSQSATSNNNQSNQLLDDTVNQMDQLENNYKTDLNNNLNNINANDFNISGITQLSNAANFVRVQFDNLTKNNPFGIILGFSLFLGLSLLIIGKRL